MKYVGSKTKVFTLLIAGIGLSGCELVQSSLLGNDKAPVEGGSYTGPVATPLSDIPGAVIASVSSYDTSCRDHATAVQQAYDTSIEGKDLSAAQVIAVLNAVPDPNNCMPAFRALSNSLSSALAFNQESGSQLWAHIQNAILPQAHANAQGDLRIARILRVAYTLFVARVQNLGSVAARAGFALSGPAVEAATGVAEIPKGISY